LRESFKEAPLEQTFPNKNQLPRIINLISVHAKILFSRMAYLVPAWHCSCHFGLSVGKSAAPSFVLLAKRLYSFWTKPGCSDDLGRYNFCVARGWESKSIEQQQAAAAVTPSPAKPPLTPGQIASQRQKQGLTLSREYVLQQLAIAQNPRHREILQRSLTDLDAQLARLV